MTIHAWFLRHKTKGRTIKNARCRAIPFPAWILGNDKDIPLPRFRAAKIKGVPTTGQGHGGALQGPCPAALSFRSQDLLST